MAKKLKIALAYSYNESWIGGTYYVENLIYALSKLTDAEQPHLLIASTSENYQRLKKKINYPYLTLHNLYDDRSLFWRAINKVNSKLLKTDYFKKSVKVDIAFPFNEYMPFLSVKKPFYWIPDFQEHFLPHFFLENDILDRKTQQKLIAESNDTLILSSKNALSNFKEIYKNHHVKPYVLNFAVRLPLKEIETLDFNFIKKEFALKDEYYICPNQFWIHKDHKTLIQAISLLKNNGLGITVYLTGKAEDYRFPGYFQELKNLIKESGVEENIIHLGFLDRTVQLSIVKNAKALIQPSLFEGWSTVIEDAKSLHKYIIASDLEVHHEQLKNYPSLIFKKGNAIDLAEKIKLYNDDPTGVSILYDYENNIRQFGEIFMQIAKATI